MTELNSPAPAPEHAPKPSKSTRRLPIGWVLVALVTGVITGLVGTVMHLNSYWTGSFGIPWGVAVALLIAGLGQWWLGLRTANVLAVGLTGIGQYVTLAVLTLFSRGDLFTVPLNAQTWEFVPHLVIATVVWHVGLLALTIVLMFRINRTLQRTKAQLATAPSTAQPAVGTWQNR
ncbi:hypothetical protein GCM10023190_08700 [Enteractinococcus fodinae]|uniref:Membrane protein n=1 Tax=Enteractinococcus fodinae TaxID=684663 RepID=A0ABU2B1M2_9MICC|nr:hypothetical protein [Enteractinococcus fodinae]MDR7346653.1 putative membrane protein [Enteractinococcus fodinae]